MAMEYPTFTRLQWRTPTLIGQRRRRHGRGRERILLQLVSADDGTHAGFVRGHDEAMLVMSHDESWRQS